MMNTIYFLKCVGFVISVALMMAGIYSLVLIVVDAKVAADMAAIDNNKNKPKPIQHTVTPVYYIDFNTQLCFAYFPGSWTEVTCTKEVMDLIK